MIELLAISLLLFAPKEEPKLDPTRDRPAPANAVFFSDCLADGTAKGTLGAQNGYLIIRCHGAPAKRFYDKLGTLPEKATFVEVRGTATWRFTTRPKENTDGLDACWQDTAAAGTEAEYGCRLIYPAGKFLDAG